MWWRGDPCSREQVGIVYEHIRIEPYRNAVEFAVIRPVCQARIQQILLVQEGRGSEDFVQGTNHAGIDELRDCIALDQREVGQPDRCRPQHHSVGHASGRGPERLGDDLHTFALAIEILED